jgi:hypothetical protein
MKLSIATSLLPLLAVPLAVACSDANGPTLSTNSAGAVSTAQPPAIKGAGPSRVGFGLNGTASGFPTGKVRLTGGGSYDPATASNTVPTETSVASSGGFDCVETIAQGPFSGCAEGQGVRWDTAQLLASTNFKCTPNDAAKLATTGTHTAVLLADFYRAGDGNHESFTAQMIVSDSDLAPNIDGIQNLWVQGVGCGTAIVNFN